MIGKTLAHYEISAKLGAGGMGEVYRARDTKLGRDVALKVIPRELSGDPERVARFAREARTLASLQHPNIASIYGFEEADGVRFLTMELAEGEDLSELLSRGPIPMDEALRMARQLAAGLEAAHAKNIVHRDLKPANVKIGADGAVKILDFGLARAYVGDAAASGDPENSPTITAAMTHAGVILGTAAYMSPEQARGRATDSRADIWAFGVVLFEMVSGRRLFSGETVSDTLASVLKTEIDWNQLPVGLPARVRTLLVRCLDRDRDRRLRDIGEARILLEDELSGAPDTHLEAALQSGDLPGFKATSEGTAGGNRWLLPLGTALLGAILATVAVRLLSPPSSPELPLRKLVLEADADWNRDSGPVIAPDGHAVAFVAATDIVVRELTARESRRFPLEEPVLDLFWSADGKQLAYIASDRLYRLDAVSGQRQVVCESEGGFQFGSGGSWGDDGKILFSQADSLGLFEVSERGGDPRLVLPTEKGREGDFHDPFVLPGGRGVLFVPHAIEKPFETIELWTGDERRKLLQLSGQTLSSPVYSPTGHILFHRSPTNPGIWAVPFSLERLEATGDPFLAAPSGDSPSVATDATLLYQSDTQSSSLRLSWNDESGREIADTGEAPFNTEYTFPALTADGRLACASLTGDDPDLWVFDRQRGTRTRLTFGEGREEWPVWTPSGDAILYHVRPKGRTRTEELCILRVNANGVGQPDTLAVGFVPAVSPDGQFLTFSKAFGRASWSAADLAYRPLSGDRSQVERLASAPGLQMDPRVAPGGRFLAYTSDESGSFEIYITRFPSGGGRWQVSLDGGMWPRWNGRGDRLFYAQGNDIMAVDVTLGDTPELGRPQLFLERPPLRSSTVVIAWPPSYDVSADGKQFLFYREPTENVTELKLIVVQNWYAEFDSPR